MSKPSKPPVFIPVSGSRDFLDSECNERRFWAIPVDPMREYSRGLWTGLLLGLAIGVCLVGYALLVGIGIGGDL